MFHALADVDYEIKYTKGSLNYLADFMSRAVINEVIDTDPKAEVNMIKIESQIN